MRFVSYSQNFEDVMLYRTLKNVQKGFYIDVGANDPTIDSVTRAFYDSGWSGINIDPSLKAYERLCAVRARDTNLNIAVGEVNGELIFYDVAVSGWSTLDKIVAERHKKDGIDVKERAVDVKRLIDICEQYVNSEIHFLKVDVEGAEELVFKGMKFDKFRPWIIVVEATQPNSQIVSFAKWEPMILEAGYVFVYFDGLNRFYVSNEHSELKKNFDLPPNVFDDFVLNTVFELEQKVSDALELAETIRREAAVEIHEAKTSAHEAHLILQSILTSRAWKITAPLRFATKVARKLKNGGLGFLKHEIKNRIIQLLNNKQLKLFIKKIVSNIPFVEERARALYRRLKLDGQNTPMETTKKIVRLSKDEIKIKNRLEKILTQKTKE